MTKTTGELLDQLFKTHRHPTGREYTYQEVSTGVGGALDPTYIAKVRKGKIPNPGRQAIMLLCRFFAVPPSYFFPELDAEMPSAAEDALSHVLRSLQVQPEVRQKLEAFLRTLQHTNEPPPEEESHA